MQPGVEGRRRQHQQKTIKPRSNAEYVRKIEHNTQREKKRATNIPCCEGVLHFIEAMGDTGVSCSSSFTDVATSGGAGAAAAALAGLGLTAGSGKIKVVAGYALQQKLGSGSFAVVYKGVRLPQHQLQQSQQQQSRQQQESPAETVAIKAINRTSDKLTKKVLQNLEVEIKILRTYRHRNIVCMHDVQKTDRHFYLVLEYCGGGDVQKLIRTRRAGRLTETLTRRLMRDLGAGLRFLWSQELIHRVRLFPVYVALLFVCLSPHTIPRPHRDDYSIFSIAGY